MKSRDMWTVIRRLDYYLRIGHDVMEEIGEVVGRRLFNPTFESVSEV